MDRTLLCCVLLVAACEPTWPMLVSVDVVGGAAVVDVDCKLACDPEPVEPLQAVVRFEARDDAAGMWAEILQYRVDYTFEDNQLEVPFHAKKVPPLRISEGLTQLLDFAPAAEGQQEWFVHQWYLTEPVDGTATLSVVGIDHRDEVVRLDTEFPIRFQPGDYAAAGSVGEW